MCSKVRHTRCVRRIAWSLCVRSNEGIVRCVKRVCVCLTRVKREDEG